MILENLKNTKIILASGSPRRQTFFREMKIAFEIRLREIEEIFPPHLQGSEITDYLAKLKADSFDDLAPNELLITSDTIVWLNGNALGKPTDRNDAISMLKKLSNSTHEVITSVCFKNNSCVSIINETTKVSFCTLNSEMIEYYIDNFKPFDKAGSYGIQDWIGLVGISGIEGSYTNVVGLPTEKVYHFLQNYKTFS